MIIVVPSIAIQAGSSWPAVHDCIMLFVGVLVYVWMAFPCKRPPPFLAHEVQVPMAAYLGQYILHVYVTMYMCMCGKTNHLRYSTKLIWRRYSARYSSKWYCDVLRTNTFIEHATSPTCLCSVTYSCYPTWQPTVSTRYLLFTCRALLIVHVCGGFS